MNWRQLAVTQGLRAMRTGSRGQLLLAVIMFLLGLRNRNKGKKELLYRKSVPVGSSIVVRHNPGGEQRLDVIDPRRLAVIDPETGEST